MMAMKPTDPFYATERWRALRIRVLRRDRWRCVLCGAPVHARKAARIDHIKPRRQHPELAWDERNLRTLCVRCDNQRHAEKSRGTVDHGAHTNGQPRDPAHWWNRPDYRAKAAGDDESKA